MKFLTIDGKVYFTTSEVKIHWNDGQLGPTVFNMESNPMPVPTKESTSDEKISFLLAV